MPGGALGPGLPFAGRASGYCLQEILLTRPVGAGFFMGAAAVLVPVDVANVAAASAALLDSAQLKHAQDQSFY